MCKGNKCKGESRRDDTYGWFSISEKLKEEINKYIKRHARKKLKKVKKLSGYTGNKKIKEMRQDLNDGFSEVGVRCKGNGS